jgi:hypothetical protein
VLSASTTSIAVEIFTFSTAPDAATADVDDACSVIVELGE